VDRARRRLTKPVATSQDGDHGPGPRAGRAIRRGDGGGSAWAFLSSIASTGFGLLRDSPIGLATIAPGSRFARRNSVVDRAQQQKLAEEVKPRREQEEQGELGRRRC